MNQLLIFSVCRHPSNLMLDRTNGKIIHIDFGDCFEVAMVREKFPEKIPFRLTRMLINAMEVMIYHMFSRNFPSFRLLILNRKFWKNKISIQFNSKTLFKDGDPVSLHLIFPGAIQTCEQYNIFTDKYTKQHRFIGQSQTNTTYTFIYKNIPINTHT